MVEPYQPQSDFLRAVSAGDIALAGSPFAEDNLRQLILMTRHDDLSNRDWATVLLAQEPIDTLEVRSALTVAANDENEIVRAKAMLGLAMRDAKIALPLVQQELLRDQACMALFEAAALIADPELIESLRLWTKPSENEILDGCALDALAACKRRAE